MSVYKKHKMVGVAFIDLMRWCDIPLAVDIAPRPRPARLKYNFIFIIINVIHKRVAYISELFNFQYLITAMLNSFITT